ncbi:hypothetical protein ABPG74_019836 [Tetrahymena malaccensis]
MDQISQQNNNEYFIIKNYKLCPIHNQRLNILRIDDFQNGQLLKCFDCLIEQPFKFVPLIKLLDSGLNTIIKGWPILEDSQIYDQLKDMKQKDDLIIQDIQKIQSFYESLKTEIISLLQKKEKDTLKDLYSRYDSIENPIDIYNRISQKEKLKEVIVNSYQNQELQNDEFSKIIKENLENQQYYRSQILDSLDKLNQKTLNFEQLFKIKDEIIQVINKINNVAQTQIRVDSLKNISQIYQHSIVDLDFKSKNIQNEGIKIIAEALQKHQKITNLNLNLSNNQIEDEGAKLIAAALEKQLDITNLTLNFNENEIEVEGAKQISLALEKLQNITSLNLDFFENPIQIEGAKHIALALEKLPNINNLSIDFTWSDIKVEGAKQITLALEKLKNLSSLTLDFYWNESEVEVANQIALGLQKLQNINRLNLSIQGNDVKVQGAKQNNITEEGAKQIAQGLEKCQNLKKLHLNMMMNNIEIEGIKQISLSIAKCLNITELTLYFDKKILSQQHQIEVSRMLQDSLKNAKQLDVYFQ